MEESFQEDDRAISAMNITMMVISCVDAIPHSPVSSQASRKFYRKSFMEKTSRFLPKALGSQCNLKAWVGLGSWLHLSGPPFDRIPFPAALTTSFTLQLQLFSHSGAKSSHPPGILRLLPNQGTTAPGLDLHPFQIFTSPSF